MKWDAKIKFAEQAFQCGALDQAVSYFQRGQLCNSHDQPFLARKLANALLERAKASVCAGQFCVAWEDLDEASKLKVEEFGAELRRQKNQLIELTIESADASLSRGEPIYALNCIEPLRRRNITDWRLDRIRTVSECLKSANSFAANGQFKKSVDQLEKAKGVRPDLPFLDCRISAFKGRQRQMQRHITDVETYALQCKWGDVSQSCKQILHIAPTHQIAFEARQECNARLKKKTWRQLDSTQVNSLGVQGDRVIGGGRAARGDERNVVVDREVSDRILPMSNLTSGNKFLLWVDGVGGYLVCGNRVNSLGQAIDGARVDIGIQGDLRSHHANLERVDGGHLLEPIGNISVDGIPLNSKVVLKNGQKLSLEGGVELAYSQTHALSKTARLNFVSRHRSVPLADAVILPGASIILGPNRSNHVYCPTWSENLLLFERSGQWFCRSKLAMEVDGKFVKTEASIELNSRIVGDDFSLTLEPA